MSARIVMSCALLIAVGCTPTVRVEDWRCATGPCPTVAPFCWSTLVCHDAPEDDGGDGGGLDAGDAGEIDAGEVDGGAIDAGTDGGIDAGTDGGIDAGTDGGPPTFDYRPCDDTRLCAASELCVRNGAGTTGYCAPPCMAGPCPRSTDGAPAYCGGTYCRVGCTTDADCPSGIECLWGRWGPDAASACTEAALATPAGEIHSDCVSDVDCAVPLACLNTVCTRPCAGSETCLPSELCQNLPPPTMSTTTCLTVCTGVGGACPALTMCREAGAGTGNYRCIPNGWPMPSM